MRSRSLAVAAAALSALVLPGCSKQAPPEEPTISIDTPIGGVDITTDAERGELSVDVDAPEQEE